MNYNWIDVPFLDAMEYFSSIFYYFLTVAKRLGYIVALVGIGWTAIQLMFASVSTEKALKGLFFKFALFFFILAIYHPGVTLLAKTVTKWGVRAGDGDNVIQTNLETLLKKAEHDLQIAESLEAGGNNTAASSVTAIPQMKSLKNTHINGSPLVGSDVIDSQGREQYVNAVNKYRTTEENREWAEKTIEAVSAVLKPTYYKDKNGNLIKGYYLDVMMKRKGSVASSFVSPNAILRIALLTANILNSRQMDYLTVKMEEGKKDAGWLSMNNIGIVHLTMGDIGNTLLTWLCCLCLIVGSIFAIIQYVMCILEYSIIASIGIVFVPFVLFDGTKSFAQKIIPALTGFAIKLLVMTLCIFFVFYQYLYLAGTQMGETSPLDWTVFAYIAFMIIISWVLTQNAPQIAMTLLTGNPQLSMGEFMQAVGTGAALGGAAVTAAAVTGKGAQIMKQGGAALIGGTTNAVVSGAGMLTEAKAAKQAAVQDLRAKGYSADEAAAVGNRAYRASVGNHIKTGFKSMAHRLSHAEGSAGGNGGGVTGGGSRFVNRYSGKDGSTMDTVKQPDANHSSFKYAKNPETGASLTAAEFLAERQNAGTAQGSAMSAAYAPKNTPPPPPQQNTKSTITLPQAREQRGLPEPSREALPEPKPRLPAP
ncbi:hypothetical protein JO41_02215 [Treponema sp. OMZ 838]|uniref:type IV secretion system protein n=1 Tax=Treponema sp. OMZ 838 TaxID=1539298 RepID=UPI00053012F9|nr:type IV secretion system protein [Treponema sp. OMZ 838]AIW88758.1 hypothetical protein JO41_02215 [Treponema sp. OMZ 838]